MSDFPRTVEEITPKWLTQVLRESGAIEGEQVIAVSVGDMGGEQGNMADVNRIAVEYDSVSEKSPRTLIVKSKREKLDPEWAKFAFPMYEREVEIYRGRNPDSNVRLPKCHFAEYDPETTATAIVLEDLGHLRTEREEDDLSLDDGLSTMRYLGRLHASWWGKPQGDNYSWLAESSTVWKNEVAAKLYQENVEGFLEYYGDHLPPGVEHFTRALTDKVVAAGEALARPPVTLVHADFKLTNMFFDDSTDGPPEIVAFDWQMAARLRGPADLGLFIKRSFDVETRRSIERKLLNEYYDTLIDNGVRSYSRDEFEWDARLSVIPKYAMRVAAFSLFPRTAFETPEGIARMTPFMKKLQILTDWNCEEVIPK